MGAERQQGRTYQLTFDFEGKTETLRHDQGGDDGIRPARPEEPQTPTASDPARALTERLMEEVTRPEHLNRAYRRVKANQGAPGVDGMTIGQLRSWLAAHKEELIATLLDGSYRPQPVRGVQIPKPGGGVRQLGIPRSSTGSCSKRSSKCSNRCWTRPSRRRAMASDPAEGRTTP